MEISLGRTNYQLTLTWGSGLSLCLVAILSGSKRFFLNNHPIRQKTIIHFRVSESEMNKRFYIALSITILVIGKHIQVIGHGPSG